MPEVEDYAALAPFTLEELVDAANAVLRDRPSLKIQGRTVRYYISNGLLPPPSGGPKFARYGLDHLSRIVAIRRGLDAGLSLEESGRQLELGDMTTQPTVSSPRSKPLMSYDRPSPVLQESVVHRIRLTERATLEVQAGSDLEQELRRAAEALTRKIENS